MSHDELCFVAIHPESVAEVPQYPGQEVEYPCDCALIFKAVARTRKEVVQDLKALNRFDDVDCGICNYHDSPDGGLVSAYDIEGLIRKYEGGSTT